MSFIPDEELDALTAPMGLAELLDSALSLCEHLTRVVSDAEVSDRVRALRRRREQLR